MESDVCRRVSRNPRVKESGERRKSIDDNFPIVEHIYIIVNQVCTSLNRSDTRKR